MRTMTRDDWFYAAGFLVRTCLFTYALVWIGMGDKLVLNLVLIYLFVRTEEASK